MKVRRLTQKGTEDFRMYLAAIRSGAVAEPPRHLLTAPDASASVQGSPEIEETTFGTRLDAARYLDKAFSGLKLDSIETDVGLWSWLSLFYFDQVCPAGPRGMRKPGRDYRHILEPGYSHGHMHLLGGPYLVYTVYGLGEELSKLLLYTPPFAESKFHHQLATRQSLITNIGILEAVHDLYFDSGNKRPKRGSLGSNSPGTLHRFIDVVQQLDLTYDLYSMTGEQILHLLPSECNRWHK